MEHHIPGQNSAGIWYIIAQGRILLDMIQHRKAGQNSVGIWCSITQDKIFRDRMQHHHNTGHNFSGIWCITTQGRILLGWCRIIAQDRIPLGYDAAHPRTKSSAIWCSIIAQDSWNMMQCHNPGDNPSWIWCSVMSQDTTFSLILILVNIPSTVISTKMWQLQSRKNCFQWFGTSPMPSSFPLPYLPPAELP